MDPRGKAVLITGGARIGAVVARHLASRGSKVALTYLRSRESAEATAKEITGSGGEAITIRVDLSEDGSAANAVEVAAARIGRLDVLVNMASVYSKVDFEKLNGEIWDRTLQTETESIYRMAIAAAPHMKKNGDGRIINFSDWIAASGRPRYKSYLPYYTAKRANIGLTEALALELAPDILVNAIAPGPILPPDEMSETERSAVEKETPLGRWGGPEEIARTVLFLIESNFITGETIRVDGGRHIR